MFMLINFCMLKMLKYLVIYSLLLANLEQSLMENVPQFEDLDCDVYTNL